MYRIALIILILACLVAFPQLSCTKKRSTSPTASNQTIPKSRQSTETAPVQPAEHESVTAWRRERDENGMLRVRYQVLIGDDGSEVAHGRRIEFTQQGTKQHEYRYTNGMKHGLHVMYYPDGTVAMKEEFVNGVIEGNCLMFYESGAKLADLSYVAGKRTGIDYFYYETGELMEEIEMLEDQYHGQYVRYDKEGNVVYMKEYVQGVEQP